MMTKEDILQLNRIEEYREGSLIEVKAAQGGRNGTVLKIFSLINYGERVGNGMNSIFYVWDKKVVPTRHKLSQVRPQLFQVCPKLEPQFYVSAVAVIYALKDGPLPIISLMTTVGEKNRSRFRSNILTPLLDSQIVEPTIMDTPNSPNQKYVLTQKGKEILII